MTLDTSTLGTAVEVTEIARELKKLWSADETRTRASLINFVIVCEGTEAMNANTELLEHITRDHACRALLIGVDADASVTKVQAWVNAHCYLPKAGAKHVCSEQISLLLPASQRSLLPNLLFTHLESDLPLTLWWQCKCPNPPDAELWRWVDRLVFDSRTWATPKSEFELLHRSVTTGRTVLCDLNWTRTLHLRQSLAQLFDQPEQLAVLENTTALSIRHAAGSLSTALFLTSWLAGQLGWNLKTSSHTRIVFEKGGRDVVCELQAGDGSAISEVKLQSTAGAVNVLRQRDSKYLHAEVTTPDHPPTRLLMPADCDDMTSLIDEELSLGGRRRVYTKMLKVAGALY